jgi:hypothetical protein
MLETIIAWLERNMQPCFYKKAFGLECPGCGMQRAFIELLKGNVWESILMYPALLPTIFMFIYLILHIIFDFKKGAAVIKYTFIINTIIIVATYLFKQLTGTGY